jgi:general secretion pathway protein N
MDWLRRNPLLALFAVVILLLAGVIGVEAGFGASLLQAMRPASVRPALPTDAKLLPPLIATAAEQAYPETTSRPLFTPTRRPAPELAAAPVSTFQKGQFVLAGVIAVGDNRIAMLREKSNGRIHRVEKGKDVNGIKVADIQREQVTLAQGGEQEVLTMSVQRPTGAPPGAAGNQGPFTPQSPPGAPQPGLLPSGQLAPGVAGGPFAPPGGPPMPPPVPGNPGNPAAALVPGANPAARATPEAPATALSPEELLARRRARRTQQTQ